MEVKITDPRVYKRRKCRRAYWNLLIWSSRYWVVHLSEFTLHYTPAFREQFPYMTQASICQCRCASCRTAAALPCSCWTHRAVQTTLDNVWNRSASVPRHVSIAMAHKFLFFFPAWNEVYSHSIKLSNNVHGGRVYKLLYHLGNMLKLFVFCGFAKQTKLPMTL